MKKWFIRLSEKLTVFIKRNRSYLKLKSIVRNDGKIYCEFNELLRLNGKLIKYDIVEIARNKNIQKNISPQTLFTIGMVYGKYQNSLQEFRVRKFDVINNTATLENLNEKIVVTVDRLLQDTELVQQINQLDLIKLIQPYSYKQGYDAHTLIAEFSEDSAVSDEIRGEGKNIVNLF
jgi:hypothetical protein